MDASDGLVVVLGAGGVVPGGGVGVGDVVTQFEVLAAVAVALTGLAVGAVDAVGEKVELVFVINHVWVSFGTFIFGGPVDEGNIGGDGDVSGGHGEGRAVDGGGADIGAVGGRGGVYHGVAVGHIKGVAEFNGGVVLEVAGLVVGEGEGGGGGHVVAEGEEVDADGAVIYVHIGTS